MKIPTQKRRHGLRFNITPLIDIVFLLIIFFLTASHFVRSETLEEVDLPEATQSENDDEAELKRLVVTVTAAQTLHVGGKEVSLAEVEARISSGAEEFGGDFEVRIRGDRTVPYETIEPIILACARAGVTRVKFPVVAK
jgi:biopolymer transport protein ExbD